MRTIGLMSGTSLDGVDAAWVETDGRTIGRFGRRLTLPYSDDMRRALRELLDLAPTLDPGNALLKTCEARLTDHHAKAVRALGEEADLIGFHGQTILHQPAAGQPGAGRTWQIGDASSLAEATGIPVAFDFRSADVAAGGQGAPLVPVVHAAMATALEKPLAIINLGGVGNITWIGRDQQLIAFDTGPANGPLDDWLFRKTGQAFDLDGRLALSGRVDPFVLKHLSNHPFLRIAPPKSLDRQDFHDAIRSAGLEALSAADGAATLVGFVVHCVAATLPHLPEAPQQWLVTGGGRRNVAIMQALAKELPAPVLSVDDVGWDGDALEAQAFGVLAARVKLGLPLTFPGTTGVPKPLTGGRIVAATSSTAAVARL
ncbi:anhydro-N-acetylmuramic acid kinase [Pseudoroseomonas globiformis]|uniref:Anhydro-N-acetylmuramic acid kinase n=1 Tax=Teichococcus globiformis TaxID=2307229 RepID=A0ABV7G1L0_9PROT